MAAEKTKAQKAAAASSGGKGKKKVNRNAQLSGFLWGVRGGGWVGVGVGVAAAPTGGGCCAPGGRGFDRGREHADRQHVACTLLRLVDSVVSGLLISHPQPVRGDSPAAAGAQDPASSGSRRSQQRRAGSGLRAADPGTCPCGIGRGAAFWAWTQIVGGGVLTKLEERCSGSCCAPL